MENNNLKTKIKIIEESSKKENDLLKKTLIDALEKNKFLEKLTAQEKEGINIFM